MTIKVGDVVPNTTLFEHSDDQRVQVRDLCAGKKCIIIGVPGAFTPVCSKQHIPSFVADYEALKKAGVDEIVCVSVNDPWVMYGWGESQNAIGKIRMLADTHGEFSIATGLDWQEGKGAFGMMRCHRFLMLVEDNVVKMLEVESSPGLANCTLASQSPLLKALHQHA